MLRAACLRGRRRARVDATRSSTSAIAGAGAGAGRPRSRRVAAREAREGGQADRQVARLPRSSRCEAAHAALADGRPHLPGRAGRDEDRQLLRPWFLLTNKPVLAVVNVGEDDARRMAAAEESVRAELASTGDEIEVLGLSRPARGGGRSARRRRSGRDARRASASARARCPASSAPPTTCSGCGPSSRRATRRAEPGRSGPAPRPRSARASSTRTCSGASSAPR